MDYEAATLDELKAEFARLAVIVDSASAERQKIHAVIKQREDSALAKVKVRFLSAHERGVLKSVL